MPLHTENLGPRLSPLLAAEIGLHESIVLLQIDYWIKRKGHTRDGIRWTRQSLGNLQRQLPFLSRSTLRRVIERLVDEYRLLYVTDIYNRRLGDKTRWFALNEKKCRQLKSIKVKAVKKTLSQNEPTLSQNGSAIFNDYNNNTLKSAHAEAQEPVYDQADVDRFDDWVDSGVEQLGPQPFLSPKFGTSKEAHPVVEPIQKSVHSVMYRLCFRAETDAEQLTLNSAQRGKVASVLGKLRDAKADFAKVHLFEAWWVDNWRSKDRATGQYQPPRPDQVLEFWNEAMKSGVKPQKLDVGHTHPKHEIADLGEIMRKHAQERNYE